MSLSLSNGLEIAVTQFFEHISFFRTQLVSSEANTSELLTAGKEALLNGENVKVVQIIDTLGSKVAEKSLLRPLILRIFEENEHQNVVDCFSALEKTEECRLRIIVNLIDILGLMAPPAKVVVQSLSATLRRLLTSEDHDCWTKIKKLIISDKLSSVSTHISLFSHFSELYEKDVLEVIEEELISPSSVTRKQSQHLIYKMIFSESKVLTDIMSLENWTDFLQLLMLLEENQQHIIDCQKQRFSGFLEIDTVPIKYRLLIFKRSFSHENKKMIKTLCRLFLTHAHDLNENAREFLLNNLVQVTAYLYLFFDGEDNEDGLFLPKMLPMLENFILRNQEIIPIVIEALANVNQAPTPIFYWLLSLSKCWKISCLEMEEELNLLQSLQKIFYLILQKHPIKIRSTSQSYIIKIVERIIKTSDSGRSKTLCLKMKSEIGIQGYISLTNPLLRNGSLVDQLRLLSIGEALISPKAILDQAPSSNIILVSLSASLLAYRERLHFGGQIDEGLTISIFELLIGLFTHWHNISVEEKIIENLLWLCSKHSKYLSDHQAGLVSSSVTESALLGIISDKPSLVIFSLKSIACVLELFPKISSVSFDDLGPFLSGNCREKGATELAWKCAYLLNFKVSTEQCLEALSMCDVTGQLSIMKLAGRHLLGQYNNEDVIQLAKSGWSEIQAAFSNRYCNELYNYFCDFLVNKNSLLSEIFVEKAINPIFKEIQEKAITRHGMILPVISRFMDSCQKPIDYPNLFLASLLSGTGFNKDVLVDLQTAKFATFLSETGQVTRIIDSEFSIDPLTELSHVRIYGIRKLPHIDVRDAICLIKLLISCHVEESRKKPRYHIESATHKIKERAWQAIVFVIAEHTCQGHIDDLVDLIIDTLNADEQTSVCMLQQIALAKLTTQDPSQWAKFHQILDSDNHKNMGGSVSSVLIVGMLLGITTKCPKFTTTLLEQCIRLQQSNNFLIRIHAIATIKSLFEISRGCEILKKRVDEKFPFLERHVTFSHSQAASGNMGRNVYRVMSNILFGKYDLNIDLTVTGIFRYIPVASGCQPDSCLSESYIREIRSSNLPFIGRFDIEPENCKLVAASIGTDDLFDETSAVQQKITPWIQDNEIDRKKGEGLVICASLIDKANNLGGITRTAEVFGTEALTFNNLSVLKDKNYTSLAVTAMKWVNILEVKYLNISSWLTEMKKKGYCLAGLEQTTNSISINEFSFPQKCVLVLGNEREGIPFDIISQLDVVLEIPQKGIIRSLNVHVSAAIAIWEYTRGNLE